MKPKKVTATEARERQAAANRKYMETWENAILGPLIERSEKLIKNFLKAKKEKK